jgi:Flp pilus assembly protein TadG
VISNNRQSKKMKLKQLLCDDTEEQVFICRFRKDENGGLIVLTLLLLISMLVVGGMAVDFMRYESERTKLQSVSDRAVLSAANLNQNRDPQDVLVEFFDAEGYAGSIVGSPVTERTASRSVVSLSSSIEMDTFFLRLIGMDTLTAPARATAIEGVANVEVSLVLDISGSMAQEMQGPIIQYENGVPIRDQNGDIVTVDGTGTRMFFLQQAASQFIDDLLLPQYRDRISINLIAYSQHVSIGDDLYYALRTTPDSISAPEDVDGNAVQSVIGSSYGTVVEGEDGVPFTLPYFDGSIIDDYSSGGLVVPTSFGWVPNRTPVFTNLSRCVTFTDEEYNTLTFNTERVYEQVELADYYWIGTNLIPGLEACPTEDFHGIILMSQNAAALKSAIMQYQPSVNTSIHRGMKWGASLLDPSMRSLISNIPTVDPAFRFSRPAAYNDPTTEKYIVIMTDGETVSSVKIRDEYYDEFEERAGLSTQTAYYYANNNPDPSSSTSASIDGDTGEIVNTMVESIGTENDLNLKLSQICNLAGAEVTDIFTISLGVQNPTMTNCASEPGNAFFAAVTNDPNEPGLGEIFARIAEQITALRLAL